MDQRDDWLPLAQDLDWELTTVSERDAFPPELAGEPWRPGADWAAWEEPFKTTFGDYARGQAAKEADVAAVREAMGRLGGLDEVDPGWLSAVLLHGAALPLAEFMAVVGNLRAARFGRTAAWRTTATYGALDELRHTQIPLASYHPLIRWDERFDQVHRFYHSNNWVAIAARRLFDELLRCADPIEFAVGTHFVFETGFTNLQFIGLASVAQDAGDRAFQRMLTSIQTDEARHAQIGEATLRLLVAQDRARTQYLLDKWIWRSWLLFAVLTGITMDYLTPLAARRRSFKEFMEEWILEQFMERLAAFGLERPWYWDALVQDLDHYHHMFYASAYTYRASVWFDMVLPGPEERSWLAWKYPHTWADYEPVWDAVTDRWRHTDPGVDFGVHGTAIPTFCNLCQLVLSHGTPARNDAVVHEHAGARYIFCSEPCRWIFAQEPERYADHKDIVKRVLAGEAPGNLVAFLRQYCGLRYETWGKDAHGGDYPWLEREG